jgi:NACalpha-BTF3-like transcription factor
MDISIEKVEKLMEKADVGYAEAKAALEAADGDLLDAVIRLEKEGKVDKDGVYYRTATAGAKEDTTSHHTASDAGTESETNSNRRYKDETTGFGDLMRQLWRFICKVVKNSVINHFDVYRYDERIVHIPVLALIVLLIACFWVTLPLLVIGLFFACRYHFSGPHLGKESINKAMDSATDTAETIKKNVKEAADAEKEREKEKEESDREDE